MQGLSLTYNIFLGTIIDYYGHRIFLPDLALRQTNSKGSIQLSFRRGYLKPKQSCVTQGSLTPNKIRTRDDHTRSKSSPKCQSLRFRPLLIL